MNRLSLPNPILDLVQRIKLACKVLVAPRHAVAASAGQLISYDPDNRRLIIQGDFQIHATGNLFLSSDQHVVLSSGNDGETYTHQIHLNPELEIDDAIHVQDDQHRGTGEPALQSAR